MSPKMYSCGMYLVFSLILAACGAGGVGDDRSTEEFNTIENSSPTSQVLSGLQISEAIESASEEVSPVLAGAQPGINPFSEIEDNNNLTEPEISLETTSQQETPVTAKEQSTPTQPNQTPAAPVEATTQSGEEVTLANKFAFPGALGWAASTTSGGREGRVVIVNSLSNTVNPNDNIMTFREAMTEIDEPRIIVFSVAGLIDYRSGPGIPESTIRLNDSDSDVTLACQSAPSPGVTLMGDGLVFSGETNNIIMRHCRFRNSDPINTGSAENSSCIRVGDSSPTLLDVVQHNYILDHVSCMWAADDPVTFFTTARGNANSGNMQNITISNSVVSEGDADSLHEESGQTPLRYLHAMGPTCVSGNANRTIDRCSIVRNLIAHNGRRNGALWGVDEGELINNIIYNPQEIGLTAKAFLVNNIDGIIKGNLIQFGPTNNGKDKAIDLGGNTVGNARLEISDNYVGKFGVSSVESYNNPPGVNSNSPNTVQVTPDEDILAMSRQGSDHLRCVGASRPARDSHDKRVIAEFHLQTGQVGIMGDHERDFSEYNTVEIDQNWIDGDKDGMPDTWETKMGLSNPNSYDLSNEYTNIEVFLNNLAECPYLSFDESTFSFPAGTREVSIPFNSNWATWSGGQSFEACLDFGCQTFDDLENTATYTTILPSDGQYQLTIAPIGTDGLQEDIAATVQIVVGN